MFERCGFAYVNFAGILPCGHAEAGDGGYDNYVCVWPHGARLLGLNAQPEMSRWSNGHTVLLRRSSHTWRNHTWEDMLQ
jgi:hypothetical protein